MNVEIDIKQGAQYIQASQFPINIKDYADCAEFVIAKSILLT